MAREKKVQILADTMLAEDLAGDQFDTEKARIEAQVDYEMRAKEVFDVCVSAGAPPVMWALICAAVDPRMGAQAARDIIRQLN